MDAPQRWHVAEISKNWPESEADDGRPVDPDTGKRMTRLLAERFEQVINTNHERGYTLHDWKLDRWSPEPGLLNETIIAVFVYEGTL